MSQGITDISFNMKDIYILYSLQSNTLEEIKVLLTKEKGLICIKFITKYIRYISAQMIPSVAY